MDLALRSPHDFVRDFCRGLPAEIARRRWEGLDAAPIERYYRFLLLPDGRADPLGIRGYACRLAPAVERLLRLPRPGRLLDVGCGFGMESLLFASLGADVTGVDIVEERVALARSRVPFHETAAGAPLRVRFERGHAIRALERAASYDLVWAMEALSHIHPVEEFLAAARRALAPGGALVFTDPNGSSPLARWRSRRIRGGGGLRLRPKGVDPESGDVVTEAVERIETAGGWCRRLKEAGFEVERIEFTGFLGSSLLPPAARASETWIRALSSFQRCMRSLPAARRLGGVLTIAAERA